MERMAFCNCALGGGLSGAWSQTRPEKGSEGSVSYGEVGGHVGGHCRAGPGLRGQNSGAGIHNGGKKN
jgi:hypothetical protein